MEGETRQAIGWLKGSSDTSLCQKLDREREEREKSGWWGKNRVLSHVKMWRAGKGGSCIVGIRNFSGLDAASL